MAFYFGSTQIPNVYFNPSSGGQTYTLTIVGSANINTNALCYNKWTSASTSSGDKSITKCVIITGTAATNTGTTTRTFTDVDTVAVSFGAYNWYGFY